MIEDADRHPEWANSPLVAGPWQFKFLAGFPIRGKQGELMGLLTLLDPQNLHLDSAVLQALGIVARQAASAILLGDTRARISQLSDEHQKVKRAYDDSESFYHNLVESLPQHIIRKDLEGRFTFANQNFCRALGKELKDILQNGSRPFSRTPCSEVSAG